MQFTIREIHTNHVVVDFPDGSWAQVPYQESMKGDRRELIKVISEYAPKPAVSWCADVPLTEGEVINSAVEGANGGDILEAPIWDYVLMRATIYPDIGDQLDAIYWASKGVNEPQEKVNAAIDEVKRLIPKSIAPMTEAAFYLFLADS